MANMSRQPSAASLAPSYYPERQRHGGDIVFSGRDFAVNGQIMLLVVVVLFACFLVFIVVCVVCRSNNSWKRNQEFDALNSPVVSYKVQDGFNLMPRNSNNFHS
ncbi:hypothetical protein M5689_009718 [Euphorbia peplus]|nr:hypothetical protein M5689_009718 [Euphorbia peplus]